MSIAISGKKGSNSFLNMMDSSMDATMHGKDHGCPHLSRLSASSPSHVGNCSSTQQRGNSLQQQQQWLCFLFLPTWLAFSSSGSASSFCLTRFACSRSSIGSFLPTWFACSSPGFDAGLVPDTKGGTKSRGDSLGEVSTPKLRPARRIRT